MRKPTRSILILFLLTLFTVTTIGCELTSASTTDTTISTTTTTTATSVITTDTEVADVAIFVSRYPSYNVYLLGETFSTSGLRVSLIRSNGSVIVLSTEQYTCSGFDSDTIGMKTITVTYGVLTTKFGVYVMTPETPTDVALQLIAPTKVVYQIAEDFDPAGLAVSVVQSNGESISLGSSSYEITGFSSSTSGMKTITVTYNDLDTTFSIYVQPALSSANFWLGIMEPTKLDYSLNDSLDLSGMVVTLYGSGNSNIQLVEGQYTVVSPNMSTAGEKVVQIVTVGDLSATFTIQVSAGGGLVIDMAYYDGIQGLSGSALENALYTILTSGFTGVNYGDARYILDESDRDPANASNLIEFYTGQSRNATWDGGITWNREHVWPQSLLGVSADNAVVNAASNLQNLTPSDPSINSSRGNKWFSTVLNTYSYLPSRSAILGDIARMLMYMDIRYNGQNSEPNLELIELGATQDPAVYFMGDLSTLLAWNLADPVDDFERNRNEVIYSYQHDRNPFIDYPELAQLIWPTA